MSTHANAVGMTVTGAPGTGLITLNALATGALQTFFGAYGSGSRTVDIAIEDPIGTLVAVERNATYNGGNPGTITRGTPETPGSLVSLTSAAVVRVAMPASTGNAIEDKLGAWGALNGENSITGTATALIGRLNVCSGTSSDYTVTLPAVSGNAGRYLGLRMAAGLTRLVTIDGNGSETIDGELTRVMWAQETALLYCDGTTWTKMAGKSRPMFCSTTRTTNRSLSAATPTLIEINNIVSELPSGLADTSAGRINIKRAGRYIISGAGVFNLSGASDNNQIYSQINGTKQEFLGLIPVSAASLPGPCFAYTATVNAAQYVELAGFSSIASSVLGNTAQLIVQEVPTW